jgi:5-methylcytosine-specific restriction endonuclease McrA
MVFGAGCSVQFDLGGAGAGGRKSAGSSEVRDLKVASAGSMSGYSREEFAHWSDATEFGWKGFEESCDVREAALIRDGKRVEVADGCEVESGRWRDPYTTATYTNPLDIDIDHVVPLANAWRSGASSWSDAEREAYANDPDVLLSVEDDANQSKGDKGPEAWKPPNREIWCDYANQWIEIKTSYDLSATPQEKQALQEMLGTC